MAVIVPLVTAIGLATPIAMAWLAFVTIPRASKQVKRNIRADVTDALAYGLIAVGAASLLVPAVGSLTGVTQTQRLSVIAPLVEEPLKAVAVIAVVGVASLTRGHPLSLRRAVVATLVVVAAFAAGENLAYLASLLTADNTSLDDTSRILATFRIRAVLPPLAHLAETWPVGAAVWLASRYRTHWPALVLASLIAAVACHALWNMTALESWPNPWPLLAILTVSIGSSVGFCLVATRLRPHQRDRAAVPPPMAAELAYHP